MGPEVDMSGKFDTLMEVSPVSMKDNSTIKLSEEKLVVCTSNCEDHGFADAAVKTPEENPVMTCASSYGEIGLHMDVPEVKCDQGMASNVNTEDVEVDIVENVVSDEEVVPEKESPDATENSSSFGCTDSETGTGGASSDVEVESEVRNDNPSLMEMDGCNDLFKTRKKKLTAQWKKFIRPLMWRCKWVELQIRELRSQASKYDRELAECGRIKHCQLEKFAAEDLAAKSSPVFQNQPVRVMKRKKRKRVEETADLAAYSSRHSLFSYFVNKRRSGDSAYLDDDHGNTEKTTSGVGEFDVNGEWSFLGFKDSDSFENILRNIEVAQIHVRQLRLRIDKVVRENAEISSIAPGGPSSILPQVNDDKVQIGSPPTNQPTSETKMIMPGNAVSDHREVNPSNMIKTADQQQIRRKCGKIDNKIVISNQPVKEESNDTEAVGTRPTAELQPGTVVKPENVHVPDPKSPSKTTASQELAVKLRSKLTTPKNKKKRGRRKARTGRWSRKSFG